MEDKDKAKARRIFKLVKEEFEKAKEVHPEAKPKKKKVPKLHPEEVKKQEESKKAKVAAFLKKAVEKHRGKKEAERELQEKLTKQKVPADVSKKFKTLLKQASTWKERDALAEEYLQYPLPEITQENAIDPYFKNKKVGDILSYDYQSEYLGTQTIPYKIVEVNPNHTVFKIQKTHTNHPEKPKTVKLQFDAEGSYLKPEEKRFLRPPKYYESATPFESLQAAEVARQYFIQAYRKKEATKEEKKAADWTKSSKDELVRIIDQHFEKEGKVMRGHKTASKPKLIELIKKYNIRE